MLTLLENFEGFSPILQEQSSNKSNWVCLQSLKIFDFLYFAPEFVLKIGTFMVVPCIGCLNKSQRNLVFPCIVSRGTANKMQMHKMF